MREIKIEKFQPGKGKTLATFDAVVNGIAFRRCKVIVDRFGKITAIPPYAEGNVPGEHGVWFIDVELRDLFRSKALAIYHAFEGIQVAEEPEDAGVLRALGVAA